jgi:hypothetical protein
VLVQDPLLAVNVVKEIRPLRHEPLFEARVVLVSFQLLLSFPERVPVINVLPRYVIPAEREFIPELEPVNVLLPTRVTGIAYFVPDN